ncbi:MAG: mechanosensitive ion channel [Anaerolineales bacterium]|nr:mechanosensitive ion channel [Anaerolineales bacterium]
MDTGWITETLQDMLARFLAFLPDIIAALVILVASLYLAGILAQVVWRALERRQTDRELTLMLTKLTRWSLVVLGIIVALQQVGFNVTAFLTGVGILGFTVGFALQDVSKNFISGMLLLLQQPFEIGDVIEVSDFTGKVLDIDLRATELLTFDGQNVLIPNADVFTSPIKNYSRTPTRRLDLRVGVAYGSDLELVRTTALQAIANIEGVLTEPAPVLAFKSFGASSIDFDLYYWIDSTQSDFLGTWDAAVVQLNRAFEAAGIEIPFPVHTVYLQK